MMNAQGPRAIRAAALWAVAILLASCVTEAYVPPMEREPAAWIKLQYVYYTGMRASTREMHVGMYIREEREEKFRPAYDKSFAPGNHYLIHKWPMHVMRIRPAEVTALRMRLAFWTTDPEPTSMGGCSATQQFNPEPDSVYLVSYTSLLSDQQFSNVWMNLDAAPLPFRLPDHCQVAIFLETPTGNGTFKLESVGEPYVE